MSHYHKIPGGITMNIRPSAAIRQNNNEIADLCRKTSEPVFLTKNGEGDLVIMDIGIYGSETQIVRPVQVHTGFSASKPESVFVTDTQRYRSFRFHFSCVRTRSYSVSQGPSCNKKACTIFSNSANA